MALILAGGGDIAPAAYDGEPHETIYSVSEERDQFEFTLARAALARLDTPLLCICRGMQVLNVACGGSLHAHVPDRFGDRVAHRLPPRRRASPGAYRPRQPAGTPARSDAAGGVLVASPGDRSSRRRAAPDRLGRRWCRSRRSSTRRIRGASACSGIRRCSSTSRRSARLFAALVAADEACAGTASRIADNRTGGGHMPGRLENKVALITGAGSGIGRASARAFAARRGARRRRRLRMRRAGRATVDEITRARRRAPPSCAPT